MSTTYINKTGQYECHQWDGTPGALSRLEVFAPARVQKTEKGLTLDGHPVPPYYWLVDKIDGDRSDIKLVMPDVFVAKYAVVV